MSELADLLEERLARLEAGEPLEACLAGLPEAQANSLRKAAVLRAVSDVDPVADRLAAERRELVRLAKVNKAMASRSPSSIPTGKAWPRWVLPVALAGSAFALFTCVMIFTLLAGLVGLNLLSPERDMAQNPTPVHEGTPASPGTTPTGESNQGLSTPVTTAVAPDPQTVALNEPHGVVEVQASDGTWAKAQAGTMVKAGQRVRTSALSSVSLSFYDGSQARLGPNSEVSVDALDAQKSGPRVVALTQWLGESDHDVATSSDAGSRYEVNTPSGSGQAKGTVFHVFVSTTLLVRFDVDEGAVEVTSLNVTVVVVAGQSTIIVAGQAPQPPVFHISGEGELEETGTTWRIAGQNFSTHPDTVIIGDPQVGDWVGFEGRVLLNGTRVADQIVLLRHRFENTFAFVGTVDAMGENEWTIVGRVVRVDEETRIEPGIEVGDLVEVKGGIAQDGTLWAASIQLVVTNGFRFTGVVQTITPDVWAVSGISVTVNVSTTIEPGIMVGDVVLVSGQILDDGVWQAQTIRRVPAGGGPFEMVGVVISLDPWIVNGIELATADWTEIDEGIEVGDTVKVEGRIRADGTWLAEEIKLWDDDEPVRFEFVSRVSSINPWIVGGIPLAVDDNTEIKGEIAVGDRVKVEGVVLSDGTWFAQEIKRLDRNRGCFSFTTVIRQVNANQIVLFDGQTVTLGEGVTVEGELDITAVIIIFGCVREDGTFVIVTIIVIGRIEVPPVPPTPTPVPQPTTAPPPSTGPIDIPGNNQTLTLTCNGNTVTIRGNDNTITMLGTCGNVTIRGNSNWVFIQSATSVTNTGNNNTIQGP
ncbi:MAG: DUF5666 domain-containing protein [Anaerolineales bacterium]